MFKVIELDCTGLTLKEIEEKSIEKLKLEDVEEAILVLLLKGTVSESINPSEIDFRRVKEAVSKALHLKIHRKIKRAPLTLLRSKPMETRESIYEMAKIYFKKVFLQSFTEKEADKLAGLAVEMVHRIGEGRKEELVKRLEEAFK